MVFVIISLIVSVLALVLALKKSRDISTMPMGNDRMKELASYIREGALTFLKTEYRAISLFIVLLTAISAFVLKAWPTALAIFLGGIFSMIAGYMGMDSATQANVRTAQAALDGGLQLP